MNVENKISDLRVVFDNLVDLIEMDYRKNKKNDEEHVRLYKENPFGKGQEKRDHYEFTYITINRLQKLIEFIKKRSLHIVTVPNENEKKINTIIENNFTDTARY